MIIGKYPSTRLRRLRHASWIRDLVAEHTLTPQDFIWPLFVREEGTPPRIPGMADVKRLTLSELKEAVIKAHDAGIPAVALFPSTPPERRFEDAREALNPQNLICRAIQAIKELNLPLGVITDVALDPYTSHGHDGIIINGAVDNDGTIEVLQRQALLQVEAGADCLAPSDMMDGRIAAIRHHLENSGYKDKVIISYAVKYASAFYGPFREAVGVQELQGLSNKKTYQINPQNAQESLREVAQDIQEGADAVIIKPGLPYLDIIRQARDQFQIPIFAYQVSGEYAMIQLAHEQKIMDGTQAMMESLIAFKRAGAQGIFTYAALDMATLL